MEGYEAEVIVRLGRFVIMKCWGCSSAALSSGGTSEFT